MNDVMRSSPKVVIIGAGFGGLAMALELARSGHRDFVVLEKAPELGGVWRENTYPGAACDVPSPYYSFASEPNPDWPHRFSAHGSIKAYMNAVVDRHGLRSKFRFGVEVTRATFDEGNARWKIETKSGEVIEADVFVPATGQLSRPAWPEIKGRKSFAGKSFHSAEWDHACDLKGKRIAVIGTGASAIQFVPRIQPGAAKLTLFQRTAPYVSQKYDRAYGALHRTAFRRLPSMTLGAERLFWWTVCEVTTLGITGNGTIAKGMAALADRHLRSQVSDPALRAKLTPDYPIGCKRILFSNDYYPALAQANVHVETAGISEILPEGIRTTDGVLHEVDVIVYGTGFATQDLLAPMDIRGRAGSELRTAWSDGARAYLGISVPTFPNMFIMYGPNTNLGAGSIIYMLECQARYIRQLVEHLGRKRSAYVEVREDVEARYDAEIQGRLAGTAWASCASWYRTASGRVANNWPGLVSEYNKRTKRVDFRDFLTVTADKKHVVHENRSVRSALGAGSTDA